MAGPFGDGACFVDLGLSLLILDLNVLFLTVEFGVIVVTGGAFDNGAVWDGSSLATNLGFFRIHEQITHNPKVKKKMMQAPEKIIQLKISRFSYHSL